MEIKDRIFGSDDLLKKKITIPEWGVDVYMHTMSARERDEMESIYLQLNNMINKKQDTSQMNIRANLIVRCAHDEKGEKIFNTNGDIKKLGDKSAAILDRLCDVAEELNAISEKDIEEMEKNSASDLVESSSSN